MDFSKLSIFNALTARMRWLSERQSVIANNVANVNTPGYRARDLEPLKFDAVLGQARSRLVLARTNPGHNAATSKTFAATDQSGGPQVRETTPTGNSVVAETEMLKVAETVADYQLMSNLYAKHVAMLKTAIGRGG